MSLMDLKTNRDLLDYKFEGYKLSLDTLPVLKVPISEGIEAFKLQADEYSFLQMHMSSEFSQLFQDQWSPSCVFYISKKFNVYWCSLMQDGHLATPRLVCKLPAEDMPKANSAIVFPSSDWAVISNGCNILYIFHTESRSAGEPWTLIHRYEVPDCSSTSYLLHGVHMTFPGREQIDCLLAHFCKEENTKSKHGEASFKCLLEWLSFTAVQHCHDWKLKRARRLEGSSSLLYAALEASCDAIYLTSETKYKVIYDSARPIEKEEDKKEPDKEDTCDLPLYTYIQTSEDITVIFRLPEGSDKSDISVWFSSSELEVLWHGKCMLSGQLENPIDRWASTWVVSAERLEVILSKAEIGLKWHEVVKGDKQGEELLDPALKEEIHNRLAHLTSSFDSEDSPPCCTVFTMDELDECDSCLDIQILARIDGNTHDETHRVNMSGHKCLFTCNTCPESLPVVCLRHDVDGLVWQPKNTSSEGELENFKVEHVATFSALGYVQASKQDKKFASCAPSFGFTVISDCNRHIYIYRQPVSLNSSLELRNRKTGECISHVAKQYVVSLENCNDILGMQITDDCIFVLSSNTLYAIKVLLQ